MSGESAGCSLCDRVAIYRVESVGFCEKHKAEALVNLNKAAKDIYEPEGDRRALRLNKNDAQLRSRRGASPYRQMRIERT